MQVFIIPVIIFVFLNLSESLMIENLKVYEYLNEMFSHIHIWLGEISLGEDVVPEFRFHSTRKEYVDIIKNENFNDFETHLKNNLNTDVQTVFVIHGYNGGNAQWPVDIADALIEKEKCNVFIVDWTGLDGRLYNTAYNNVPKVGKDVGLFIKKLINLIPKLSPEKVHLAGHSLGAHVSGFAGKYAKDNGFKLGRITGLDPAGPGYNDLPPEKRLDYQDADFVDVIHTNWAGKILEAASGFGLEEAVGNFDFYPNGGEDQPGCKTAGRAEFDIGFDLLSYLNPAFLAYKMWTDGTQGTEGKIMALACSHSRAHELFYWSIQDNDNDCTFSANECPSWKKYKEGKCGTEQPPEIRMGYYSYLFKDRTQTEKRRKLYLRTNSTEPYCEN